MLEPMLVKNDKKARIVIFALSIIVFLAVAVLSRVQVPVGGDFDIHIFAKINAVINSIVSVLLVAGLVTIKNRRNYLLHKNIMLAAMMLSALFLVSYIAHHLFAGDTKFGGEGAIRYIYFFILITHIFLRQLFFLLFYTLLTEQLFPNGRSTGDWLKSPGPYGSMFL